MKIQKAKTSKKLPKVVVGLPQWAFNAIEPIFASVSSTTFLSEVVAGNISSIQSVRMDSGLCGVVFRCKTNGINIGMLFTISEEFEELINVRFISDKQIKSTKTAMATINRASDLIATNNLFDPDFKAYPAFEKKCAEACQRLTLQLINAGTV